MVLKLDVKEKLRNVAFSVDVSEEAYIEFKRFLFSKEIKMNEFMSFIIKAARDNPILLTEFINYVKANIKEKNKNYTKKIVLTSSSLYDLLEADCPIPVEENSQERLLEDEHSFEDEDCVE
jgi:hypothetical protein